MNIIFRDASISPPAGFMRAESECGTGFQIAGIDDNFHTLQLDIIERGIAKDSTLQRIFKCGRQTAPYWQRA